jgi:nanoRNase/pAp phosphatase (c-di-AMP/oligoRNAs hydrolase)
MSKKSVIATKGISESAQAAKFSNATIQPAGEGFVMSIRTQLSVPDRVAAKGQAAILSYVTGVLTAAAFAANSEEEELQFEVQFGPKSKKAIKQADADSSVA